MKRFISTAILVFRVYWMWTNNEDSAILEFIYWMDNSWIVMVRNEMYVMFVCMFWVMIVWLQSSPLFSSLELIALCDWLMCFSRSFGQDPIRISCLEVVIGMKVSIFSSLEHVAALLCVVCAIYEKDICIEDENIGRYIEEWYSQADSWDDGYAKRVQCVNEFGNEKRHEGSYQGDVIIQVSTYLLDLRIVGINLTVAIIGTLLYRCFISQWFLRCESLFGSKLEMSR